MSLYRTNPIFKFWNVPQAVSRNRIVCITNWKRKLEDLDFKGWLEYLYYRFCTRNYQIYVWPATLFQD